MSLNSDTNINKSNSIYFFKRHYILTGFLIAIIAIVGWWKYEFPSATWRYKLTVTVETPEGIKSGYAVRQIWQFTDFKIGDAGGGAAGATGEAVVVDLGQRGKLFMTIGEDFYFMFEAFPFEGANTPAGIKYYSHLKNAKASILSLKNTAPQLVTFTNINDPLTVKAVDPRNLSATFGEGVSLKDITIETTDEPMTLGIIETNLPWLSTLKGNLKGELYATSGGLAGKLDKSDFEWGNK